MLHLNVSKMCSLHAGYSLKCAKNAESENDRRKPSERMAQNRAYGKLHEADSRSISHSRHCEQERAASGLSK